MAVEREGAFNTILFRLQISCKSMLLNRTEVMNDRLIQSFITIHNTIILFCMTSGFTHGYLQGDCSELLSCSILLKHIMVTQIRRSRLSNPPLLHHPALICASVLVLSAGRDQHLVIKQLLAQKCVEMSCGFLLLPGSRMALEIPLLSKTCMRALVRQESNRQSEEDRRAVDEKEWARHHFLSSSCARKASTGQGTRTHRPASVALTGLDATGRRYSTLNGRELPGLAEG